MNAISSKILRYIIVLFALISIYLVIAFVACVIPSKHIRSNIELTLKNGDLQTDYPKVIIDDTRYQMDNFTDALILSQAYYCDRSELKRSMLLVPYSSAEPGKTNIMTDNLRNLVYDKGNVVCKAYPRYWHGSAFIMRILLLLADYSTIRIGFYIASSLLMLLTLIILKQNTNIFISVAYLLSLLIVNIFVTQFSIQFLPVLLITLIATVMLFRQKADKRMLFFVIGSLTAFFDLLTTPLLTLCLPLSIMTIVLYHENRANEKYIYIKTAIVQSLLWSTGFALTWLSKWCIATLFTDYNVFLDGYNAVVYRSAGLDEFSRADAITANINMLPLPFILTIIGVLLILALIRFNKQGLKPASVLLLISAIPYLWYFLAANHSYLHWWFTYRLQAVSILAIILSLSCLIDWKALKNSFKHIKK